MGAATNSSTDRCDSSSASCAPTNPKSIDVLGLGCTAVDDLLYVSDYPPEDGKTPVRQRCRQCGGLTAAALAAATRMGARCAYAGSLGNDELSCFVERQLSKEGIDLKHLRRQQNAKPVRSTVVVNEARGTRTIFYDADGAGGAGADWPREEVIRAAKVLFVDAFGIEGMIRAANRKRRGHSGRGRFREHPSRRPFCRSRRLGQSSHCAHFLGPAMHESLKSRRSGGNAMESAAAGGRRHLRRRRLLVRRLRGFASARHQPAYRVEAVDTTGCGDVFHGAYAASLAQGLNLTDCIRTASAAAALKARQHGGQAGLPTRANVDAFLRERQECTGKT